jgi:gamma-glutamylcyclotransferase (GGCT)/AIG2-like uncharacterized protein YtfP
MPGTGHHLFVYGTLMPADAGALGRVQRERLARESRGLGPAVMAGAQLFNLGRYPGLVETGDNGHIVHGEALELLNPSRTLHWLDAYEGIGPGDGASEYARLERTVRLVCGTELTAWVYVFLQNVTHRRPIPSGRWP